MRERGWVERLLLAVTDDEKIVCLTGIHRIHAAREAQLSEIPVHLLRLDDEQLEKEWAKELIQRFWSFNSDLVKLVRQAGDSQAIDLMEAEDRA